MHTDNVYATLLGMLLPFFVTALTRPATSVDNGECVVLFHGIFNTSIRMSRLQYALNNAGYSVLSVSYPSRSMDIAAIGKQLAPLLAGLPDHFTNVHLVGFSMGGLVARAYLAQPQAIAIARLVCIGTPNQGTEYIDNLRHYTLTKKIFAWLGGPSGNEMSSKNQLDSIIHSLGTEAPAHTEVGVIAGNRGWSIGRPMPKPHDGKVPVSNTKLAGMKDFIQVPYSHTTLPFQTPVLKATIRFLESGTFSETK